MTISARNVFKGKVTALKEGPIHAELEISTEGGDTIVATVTDASVRSLRLAVGSDAVAVVKAPWITLLAGTPEYRFSARNQIRGEVSGFVRGGAISEVRVALPGGSTLSSLITNEAVADLGLQEGTPVVAMFKASHVVVGVPA